MIQTKEDSLTGGLSLRSSRIREPESQKAREPELVEDSPITLTLWLFDSLALYLLLSTSTFCTDICLLFSLTSFTI